MRTRIFRFLLMFVLMLSMVSVNADAQRNRSRSRTRTRTTTPRSRQTTSKPQAQVVESFDLKKEVNKMAERGNNPYYLDASRMFNVFMEVGDDIRAVQFWSDTGMNQLRRGEGRLAFKLELLSSGSDYESMK